MIDYFIIPKSQFWDPLTALCGKGFQNPKNEFWCRQGEVFFLKMSFGVGKLELKNEFWCSYSE